MPQLNIFENDAFSVASLTKSINETPYTPGRISELGLFSEEGITTTSVQIEKEGETLSLVPAGVRGQPAQPVTGEKRQMLSLSAIHLPQSANILADEVQNVRAFGSESELQTVQGMVNKRLGKMRKRLDATIEYQRLGALKGQILDADGSSVLVDLFLQFGVTKQTVSLALGTPTTSVRNKVVGAKRKSEDALGNLNYRGMRAFCASDFFDALVAHEDVKAAYDRYMNGEFLRNDVRGGFLFAGVIWEEYRGKVGGVDYVPSGKAMLVPEGVPELFATYYAPADYVETVNTIGLPYYAKQELTRMGKGVDIEGQSNPISLCTLPRAVIELTA